jgi:hypothetical protein
VTVKWATKEGNHTWVEIWDGSAWRFCGADEPDSNGLDPQARVGDRVDEGAQVRYRGGMGSG